MTDRSSSRDADLVRLLERLDPRPPSLADWQDLCADLVARTTDTKVSELRANRNAALVSLLAALLGTTRAAAHALLDGPAPVPVATDAQRNALRLLVALAWQAQAPPPPQAVEDAGRLLDAAADNGLLSADCADLFDPVPACFADVAAAAAASAVSSRHKANTSTNVSVSTSVSVEHAPPAAAAPLLAETAVCEDKARRHMAEVRRIYRQALATAVQALTDNSGDDDEEENQDEEEQEPQAKRARRSQIDGGDDGANMDQAVDALVDAAERFCATASQLQCTGTARAIAAQEVVAVDVAHIRLLGALASAAADATEQCAAVHAAWHQSTPSSHQQHQQQQQKSDVSGDCCCCGGGGSCGSC